MGRVADRQQPWHVPRRQPVQLYGQQVEIADLVQFGEIEVLRDLAGIERVVVSRR